MIDDLEAVLQPYQPARATVYVNDRIVQQIEGRGGGLSEAIELYGLKTLYSLLKVGQKLELFDDEQTVVLTRFADKIEIQTYLTNHPPSVASIPVLSSEKVSSVAPKVVAVNTNTAEQAQPKPLLSALGHIAIWDPSRTLYLQADKIFDVPIAYPDSILPSSTFRQLGPEFCDAHSVTAPYVAGAMAGGIASTALVRRMSNAGMLCFFGTGGLDIDTIEAALKELSDLTGPYGFNLLNNPAESAVEAKTVDLFLQYNIRCISASAYVRLSPALVRYRVHGIHTHNGNIVCPNKVFAKCSHPSVAKRFMEPPPSRTLQRLVQDGYITEVQAELATQIPMAEDITIEADSGGHTDRRPFPVLIPTMRALRDSVVKERGYQRPIRLGAAGGIGDPYSLLAAFDLGADYVLTGSINQATLEAATSPAVKELLVKSGVADCAMGAAPDMFEQGAHVQVLGKGTMYAQRSTKLRSLYQVYGQWDNIPQSDRERLERHVFRQSFEELWAHTQQYWQDRDPRQIERASSDAKHQLALCFRWYLGMSSRWARTGDPDRIKDYQIWCGPSMGAFNSWVRGSWLEPLSERHAEVLAHTLLQGALTLQRLRQARQYGVDIPFAVQPDKAYQKSDS